MYFLRYPEKGDRPRILVRKNCQFGPVNQRYVFVCDVRRVDLVIDSTRMPKNGMTIRSFDTVLGGLKDD